MKAFICDRCDETVRQADPIRLFVSKNVNSRNETLANKELCSRCVDEVISCLASKPERTEVDAADALVSLAADAFRSAQ